MKSFRTIAGAIALAATQTSALADAPGQGLTARYEVEFMQMTIDHHYSALRMTELAAGTDLQRSPEISPTEGTSPTPGLGATPAKATLDELKSMARRNNRMQREEIMTLQRFLRDWYGVDYQPRLREDGKAAIAILEQAQPGADFNKAFYETLSRHHYMLMEPVNGCMTGSDLMHHDLRRECRGMWHSQIADIEMMRNELKKQFGIADYQPFRGLEPLRSNKGSPRGHRSGSQ
ncbi:MAG TPA: DUF305 domain-containing protein [Methylibium sp.]|uniref:DUF305 domain-containing protein n=1 Tax=Methylibium sp. TaxID=2067992 RepID=UPI002DBF82B9|nr:DUF305 domain-containing protein [Methylibium sp.]HEU4459541.1 DUF305 domain-containing protein [Methylibium sp.]